jgi:medium-chain acyl-[acyl-carrier-protein] hydrolase
MQKQRLFCIPYAGGTSAIFKEWKKKIDKHVEIYPIELAGRGKRIYDPFYQTMEEAAEDIFNQVKPELNQYPYAIYGHSLGSMIAYQLAQKIRDEQQTEPIHLFLSGRGAPNYKDEEEDYHTLSDEEFKERIMNLGGTPKEFFEQPELLEVLLPMLKNDFRIAETFPIQEEVKPFDYGITVCVGKDEKLTADQVFGWKDHTKQVCTVHYFEGDHFFIHDEIDRIIKIINHKMKDLKN